MDSGNSGSIQSSSGGDEEYDSSINRPDSVVLPHANSFLHPSIGVGSTSHFNHLSSSNPPPPQQQQQQPSSSLLPRHQPTLYGPPPSLFLAFSQPNSNPTSSLVNLDSRGLIRPDPNCTGLGNLTTNASLSSQSILGSASHQAPPLSSDHQTTATTSQAAAAPATAPTRNPKKRTRASRRAPTTVLTTDTTNFRAMVQEFTGIPAPPFSASPYTRTRLDLFGSASTGSSIIRSSSGHIEPMSYNIGINPLRPSPQKFLSSSNPNATSATNNNGNSSTFINPASSVGYQLGSTSDHFLNLPKQQQPPQTMLNMQNQMLSFQSLLNPIPTTHPLHPLGGKSPLASLEELGSLGHGLTSNSWRDGGVSTEDNGSQRGDRLRPFDGSCKLNYSAAASSDHFHHDKGLESANVSSRGEGTVDSWICPTD